MGLQAFVNPVWRALRRRSQLAHAYLRVAKMLGVTHALRRWRNDRAYARQRPRQLAAVTRGIWSDAAAALGADMVETSPSVFEFRRDAVIVRVLGQRTPLSTPDSIERATDKPRAYRLLREAEIPTPDYIAFPPRKLSEAKRFLESAPSSCIVKPARGSGGQGVVGGIRSRSQLERVVARLSGLSVDILLEREVPGDHYRLLMLDGKLLDVVRRLKPQVVGDGSATVEELMFREYERRLDSQGPGALKPLVVDLDCIFTLELQGLEPRSILPEGKVATVMSASNFGGPADSETYRGAVSSELVEEARRACEVLGVRLGGVDVIAVRTDVSLSISGGAVLEVNSTPSLAHHYAVAEPASATRVAIPILAALLADAGAQREAAATSAD